MRNRPVLILAVILAVCAWISLVIMMNSLRPEPLTELLFVCLLFVALSASAVPVTHALNARWAAPMGRRGDTGRAVRQGAIFAALGAGLVSLRFLGCLTSLSGLGLALLALASEALVYLRQRRRGR